MSDHDMLGRPATGVIVTGGGSGIGRACARALADIGRPVAVWDLDAERATDTATSLSVPTVGIGVDVADVDAVTTAVEQTRSALPSIGGLVHAAGIVVIEPIGAIDFDSFGRVLDVNLTSFARISQLVLPDLVAAGTGSAIVGISSIEALVGNGVVPAYCSSKAAMLGLVRSMAGALGPQGIRVNAVCPGYIDTPMIEMGLAIDEVREAFVTSSALRRLGTPDDIAGVVRFLLSAEAAFITGQSIVVDGGVTAHH